VGVLFFAPGISPGTAEKRSQSAPGKAFSLSNIAARPEYKPPAPEQPRREEVKNTSPDGVVTEKEDASAPSQEASFSVPAAFSRETREDVFARYAGAVRQRIAAYKEYPYAARRQSQEGSVEVRFTLSRNGRLAGEPVLEKGCRFQKLNAAALDAVRRASPYPAFPAELSGESLSFSVVISFSLRDAATQK
jgi:protein TonB